ncbi:hypothetical protein ACEZCY_14880 [Streptacidiphilus sp. N1-12]|uniref:Uncharacterized protein n=2 Tax=Streptacidiphilus alkalitolerans TaxID=3342712 RepID=A0ABV6WEP7_9ACTN
MVIRVSKVTNPAELREFCDLPLRLHPPELYVPVPEQRIQAWYRGTGPQRRYGPVDLYLARDGGGRVVGRTCLHRNTDLDRRLGRPVQLFGLTEFADRAAMDVDGDDPAKELLDLAEQAATVSGCDLLLGPAALLPDRSPGVLTSGFDLRGCSDGGWNPAHYAAAYARHGFSPRWPGQTWLCEGLDDPGRLPPEKAFAFDERRIQDERLVVHRGRRRALRRVLPRLLGILNPAPERNPAPGQPARVERVERAERGGEVSAADFADFVDYADLAGRAALDPDLLLYLTRAGEPVSFLLAVPDPSVHPGGAGAPQGRPTLQAWQALQGLQARTAPLLRRGLRPAAQQGPARPWGQAQQQTQGRRRGAEAVLVASGTAPQWQRRGYSTLLARELYRNLGAGGYATLRGRRVPPGDRAAEAPYRGMGGRPLQQSVFYERSLR